MGDIDLDRKRREDIVEVGRRMYARGMIAAADGNVTIRTPEGELYVTPSGSCKGYLEPADIVVTDLRGRPLGAGRPSSEIEMHVAIYDVRPDVFAVVHAHPPLATGFAAAGVPLSPALLSEIILTLGCVPLAEYATPTTSELADTLRRWAKDYDGLLLSNHGAVTIGKDVYDAYFKMETVEHYAKINLVTKVLGAERPLPGEAVEKLMDLRRKAGVTGGDAWCGHPPAGAAAGPASTAAVACAGAAGDTVTLTRQELIDLVVRAVEATSPS